MLNWLQIVFVFEGDDDDEVEAGFLDKIFIGPQYMSIHSCGIVDQASAVRPLPFVVISFM